MSKIIKSNKRKTGYIYKKLIRPSSDILVKFLKARKEWHHIFTVLKGKKPTTKNTVLSKNITQNYRIVKSFPGKQKLKEFTTMKLDS